MSIDHRLKIVERQLRTTRLIIAGLLLVLVALVGIGATMGIPDSIHAGMFVVDTEKVSGGIAVIASHDLHGGKLWVLDKNDIPKIKLGINQSGEGYLVFKRKNGDVVFPPNTGNVP